MKRTAIKTAVILLIATAAVNSFAQNTSTAEPSILELLFGSEQTQPQKPQTYGHTSPQKQHHWYDIFSGAQTQQQSEKSSERPWWQDLIEQQTPQQDQTTHTDKHHSWLDRLSSWKDKMLGRQQPVPQQPARAPASVQEMLQSINDPAFTATLNRIKANPAGINQWINTPVNGTTPLMSAVQQNALPLAVLLLLTGANATSTDASGRTPLDVAQQQGNQEMAKALQFSQSGFGKMASNFIKNRVISALAEQPQSHHANTSY